MRSMLRRSTASSFSASHKLWSGTLALVALAMAQAILLRVIRSGPYLQQTLGEFILNLGVSLLSVGLAVVCII